MIFSIMDKTGKIPRSLSLGELLQNLNFDLPKEYAGIPVAGITDDSRRINPGDVFFAVPGHSADGRKYISEAVSLGASAIITTPGEGSYPGVPVVRIEDLRGAMSLAADRYFDHPSSRLTVAAVTGTNGKTTVTYLLSSIFNSSGKRWGKIGTIGYETGGRFIAAQNTTPGAIDLQRYFFEMIENGYDGCAMEVSSHALDQRRCEHIQFDLAAFTNLTQDHLDYHKDMDSYFLAKSILFEKAPISVINVDDEYGRRLLTRASGRIITYGSDNPADLQYRSKDISIHSSALEFKYEGRTIGFDFPLPGLFNHQNAAAAAASAIGLGLSLEEAVKGLSEASPVPGRLQPIRLGQPFGVYIDYAHTPGALERLLTSLREFKPGMIHIVFGCGGDRDRKKRPLMGQASSTLADRVYLTSDNPRTEDPMAIINEALKGITDRKRCQVIEDRALAIRAAINSASDGDIVAIAGKGHEDYQVVGTVKKYFSDVEVAKSALRKLGYDNNDG